VLADRSDPDPPSLTRVLGFEPLREMRRGSGNSIRARRYQTGTKGRIQNCSRVRFHHHIKAGLAKREASIQSLPRSGRAARVTLRPTRFGLGYRDRRLGVLHHQIHFVSQMETVRSTLATALLAQAEAKSAVSLQPTSAWISAYSNSRQPLPPDKHGDPSPWRQQ
jgi:hypothetical protein